MTAARRIPEPSNRTESVLSSFGALRPRLASTRCRRAARFDATTEGHGEPRSRRIGLDWIGLDWLMAVGHRVCIPTAILIPCSVAPRGPPW